MRPLTPLWIYLIPVLLVTAWLGMDGADWFPVSRDELYSLEIITEEFEAARTPAGVWDYIAGVEPNPPGYYMTLNLWWRLGGDSMFALRLLSLLAGLLAVAWMYRLGRDLLSPQVGLYAAAALGTATAFIHYTYKARAYAPVVLLTVLTLWLYTTLSDPRRKATIYHWLGLALSAALYLHLQYLNTLPLVALGLWHLWRGVRTWGDAAARRRWWGVTLAALVGGVLFIPWLVTAYSNLTTIDATVTGNAALQNRALAPPDLLLRMANLFSNGATPLLVALLLLALIPLLRPRSQAGQFERSSVRQVWFLAVTVLVAIVVVNELVNLIPRSRLRYTLMWQPLLLLLLALGLAQLSRVRRARWLAPLLLLVWMGLGIHHNFARQLDTSSLGIPYSFPVHEIARDIESHASDGDSVVIYMPPGGSPDQYRRVSNYYFRKLPYRDSVSDLEMSPVETGSANVWIAVAPDEFPPAHQRFETVLEGRYNFCGLPIINETYAIFQFAALPGCCPATVSAGEPALRFGADIAVAGVELLPIDETGRLPVSIAWAVADGLPTADYSLTLQVFDAGGAKVHQRDEPLPWGEQCKRTLLDITALPPGAYNVRLGVYPWQTGIRRAGGVTATGEMGDLLPVGVFAVE